MKILICGSRSIWDRATIAVALAKIIWTKPANEEFTIISGGARGADTLGEQIAHELGFEVQRFPADWSRGKGAGFARNIQMLEQLDPRSDLVLAIWDGQSNGTKHTITQAKQRNIPTLVVVDNRPMPKPEEKKLYQSTLI
jgi:hypothetical protein